MKHQQRTQGSRRRHEIAVGLYHANREAENAVRRFNDEQRAEGIGIYFRYLVRNGSLPPETRENNTWAWEALGQWEEDGRPRSPQPRKWWKFW